MLKDREPGITETLETVKQETDGNEMTLGESLEALKHRGFGPMLMLPAVITLLPTGVIPSIPTICALYIIFVCSQVIIGREYPWLPKFMKKIKFNRQKYKKAVATIKPYSKWLDSKFKQRLDVLVAKFFRKVIAVLCIPLACLMSAFELIPFMADIPASIVLFFGLGLSTRDGLMVAIGLFLFASLGVGGVFKFLL